MWASLWPSYRWSDFTFPPYEVTSQGLCDLASLRAPFSPAPQTRFSVCLSFYWPPVPDHGWSCCLLSEEIETQTQTTQSPLPIPRLLRESLHIPAFTGPHNSLSSLGCPTAVTAFPPGFCFFSSFIHLSASDDAEATPPFHSAA